MKKLTTDIIKNIEELFPDAWIDIKENANTMEIRFGNGSNPEHVKVTIGGDNVFNVCLRRSVCMWRFKDAGSISTGEIVDIHYGEPEVKCCVPASEAGVFITAKVVHFLSSR